MGKWTRRGFITAGVLTGGALVVGVAIRPGHRAPKLAGMVADENETLVNVWVKIGADNEVTAIVPHSEMGQGVFTVMAQMLADEMDADWEHVTYQQAPAHEEYANFPLAREYILGGAKVPGFVEQTLNGAFLTLSKSMALQITGGSTAVRFTGTQGMRLAGAAAREMIVKAAAKIWDVPSSELRTKKSYVYHDASARSASYASFAEEAGKHTPPTQPKLKTPEEYRLMGKPLKRFDIPGKVDGTAEFGIDVDLPGMKYAAVMGPPVLGTTILSVDDSYAKTMPGFIKTVTHDNFVAVIADGYWQAQQAVQQLDVTFSEGGNEGLSQAALYDQFRTDMEAATANGKETKDVSKGNARRAAASAARVFEAEYSVPFLAHAAMEPINATAHLQGDKLDLWIGHQNPLGARNGVAEAMGLKEHNVTIHNRIMGGAFGRRSDNDYPIMAAKIAAEVDYPVKMIWSREEDTTQDHYRQAAISRFKAGIDEAGMPVSWENQFVDKHEPIEATHIAYDIPHQYMHYTDSPHHVRFGPWRSVDHSQHGFFIESFVDELAHEAGMDGYAFRRRLLKDNPRYLAVLDAAAKSAGWGRTLPEGHGLGIGIVDSFGTIVAQVAEVDATGDEPRVLHVYAAADAGYVMNPDGFRAQIEGGIMYGLTAALYGEISIENGAVAQSNFHDYQIVRMNKAPDVTVEIINSHERLGGGGEPGTPPIAPAVANAIFAATGNRIRQLPLGRGNSGVV